MEFSMRSHLVVLAGCALTAGIAVAQVPIVPGSATRGALVFQDKRCGQCHSITDLRSRETRTATPAMLATTMWNHTPGMWAAFERNSSRSTMSSMETADLFSYFYSMNYFTEPGNPGRGKVVFEEKG